MTEDVRKLQERYDELKLKLTELRKKGLDTSIARLILMNAPAKIQMASVTGDEKDVATANQVMDEVEQELQQLHKEITLAEEAAETFAHEQARLRGEAVGSPELIATNKLIKEANMKMDNGDVAGARLIYGRILHHYKELPAGVKKNVLEQCTSLHKRIVRGT